MGAGIFMQLFLWLVPTNHKKKGGEKMVLIINHLNPYKDNFGTRHKVIVFKSFTWQIIYTYG
tara:strand:+ start:359 stop:544 length:186 start_codon:yes stop_codon:yes gene_type:complete